MVSTGERQIDERSIAAMKACIDHGRALHRRAHLPVAERYSLAVREPGVREFFRVHEGIDGRERRLEARDASTFFVRIPIMSISHSDLMPIRSERSDAELSQCETVIGIRQEFCWFSLS